MPSCPCVVYCSSATAEFKLPALYDRCIIENCIDKTCLHAQLMPGRVALTLGQTTPCDLTLVDWNWVDTFCLDNKSTHTRTELCLRNWTRGHA